MVRRLRCDEYTVAWVCTQPIELAAGQQMLDEIYDNLAQREHDKNKYVLGHIKEHNVVIACLSMGPNGIDDMASGAKSMKSFFPSIRVALMGGVGSGVPSPAVDIRLGDIVVSDTSASQGSVIQYDFGETATGDHKRVIHRNTPPKVLITAVSELRANYHQILDNIQEHVDKLCTLRKFHRHKAEDDILFDAEYNHVGGDTCVQCDATEKVDRKKRNGFFPRVHYGGIASGDQPIEDGRTRDEIGSIIGGVLCFEMVAARLMKTLPSLVIRGVCDYADSHGNKSWQPYAAATAAAYAKELLLLVPASNDNGLQQANVAGQSKLAFNGPVYGHTVSYGNASSGTWNMIFN